MNSSQHEPQDSSQSAESKVRLSEKLDSSVDPEVLAAISPHPPGDQVDRSVVLADIVTNIALWALRLLIIGGFLYAAGIMLGNFWRGILPVLLALIVCTVLSPVAGHMRRAGVPAGLAALMCILGFFGFFGALIAVIAPDFGRQSQTLYLQTVEGIQRLQLWTQGPPLNLDNEDLGRYIDEVAAWAQKQAGSIAESVFSGIGTATTVLVTLVIVLVLTFFFLKDGHRFLGWLRDATGRRAGWHLTEVLTRAWNTLGGYIRAQALVSLIDAIVIGTGLVIIGVPLAMALAIITFIAGFIPFVGAIVAGALSVTIALVSLGVTEAIIVLVLVLVVQQLEGNVLSPWLQSKAMNLHPVVVLISVTLGSALFGLVGAFLAVPAAATMAVVYRYFQDIIMLQSGEKASDDIEFATVAGHLIGKYTEDEGRLRRAELRQAHSLADDAGLDVDSVNMDAAPSARPGRPALPNVSRADLQKAKDVLDTVFGRLRP